MRPIRHPGLPALALRTSFAHDLPVTEWLLDPIETERAQVGRAASWPRSRSWRTAPCSPLLRELALAAAMTVAPIS